MLSLPQRAINQSILDNSILMVILNNDTERVSWDYPGIPSVYPRVVISSIFGFPEKSNINRIHHQIDIYTVSGDGRMELLVDQIINIFHEKYLRVDGMLAGSRCIVNDFRDFSTDEERHMIVEISMSSPR